MIESTPRFIQGIFDFTGAGYDRPEPVAQYTVAADKRAQLIYMRAGNSSDALVVLTLTRDGETMRLFPIGAKGAEHVALAVVEDIPPEACLEIRIAAPADVAGSIIVDFGIVEV